MLRSLMTGTFMKKPAASQRHCEILFQNLHISNFHFEYRRDKILMYRIYDISWRTLCTFCVIPGRPNSAPSRGGGGRRSQGWVDYDYDYEAAGIGRDDGREHRVRK